MWEVLSYIKEGIIWQIDFYKEEGRKCIRVFNYLSPKRQFYNFSIHDKKARAKDSENEGSAENKPLPV